MWLQSYTDAGHCAVNPHAVPVKTLLSAYVCSLICCRRCCYPHRLSLPSMLHQRIASHEEYVRALSENENQLVVLKFFAPWCRSCKAMDVKYRRLALENENVRFYEVGVNLLAVASLILYPDVGRTLSLIQLSVDLWQPIDEKNVPTAT